MGERPLRLGGQRGELQGLASQAPIAEAAFAISGVQLNGGGEFKSVFEAECQARGLELFGLPPKGPDLNGCIEHAQC